MAEFVAANGYRQCRERGHHTRWKPRALLLVVVVLAMAVKVAAAAQAAHLLAQEKSCTSSARGIGRRWRRGRRRRAPTFEAKDQACIVLWHQCISPLPSPFPSPNCKVAARGPLWGEQLLSNSGKGRGRGGGSGDARRTRQRPTELTNEQGQTPASKKAWLQREASPLLFGPTTRQCDRVAKVMD